MTSRCRTSLLACLLFIVLTSASISAATPPGQTTMQIATAAAGSDAGVPSVSMTALPFGNVVSGASTSQVLWVSNLGNAPLTITGASISGPNASEFAVTNTCTQAITSDPPCSLNVTFTPSGTGTRTATLTITDSGVPATLTVPLSGTGLSTAPLTFVPVTPCRVVDTRNANGAFGGPEMPSGSTRNFVLPNSGCGIPSTARAYSLNVTVVPDGWLSYLSVWPEGQTQPTVSTLNSDGRVKANAAIVPAGASGGISVYVTDPTHVVIDINGYFVPAGSPSGLSFYPVTPCRIADTRNATGALGGPSLKGGVARAFPILSSACNLPTTAQAYSLNVTAVPHNSLWYLTTWPAGQKQPVVSTLNSPGSVTANAAIVPAGAGGAISLYATNDADVVIDVNGYFAPPATGGLSLYPWTPCRLLDTRIGAGGPINGAESLATNLNLCIDVPSAQALVANATVVPTSPLWYLTLWTYGEPQPLVSTLNAPDGVVTSNAVILPVNVTNANGTNPWEISAYATNPTHLVLDVSAYFAP